jgi:nicotinamide mononucleotide adenylyltransferase
MRYLARTEKPSPEGWAMFIGRWQPWHAGHRWLIDQQLNEGKKVWIAIRDMEPNEKNPFTAHEVLINVTKELFPMVDAGQVRISIIPDIASINIGREIGYDIIEHEPPTEIKEISATKIREEMKKQGKL